MTNFVNCHNCGEEVPQYTISYVLNRYIGVVEWEPGWYVTEVCRACYAADKLKGTTKD